jgi:hypothetical protein
LVNQTLQIMKSRFLFAHRWRLIGYLLLAAGLLFYLLTQCTGIQLLVWHNFRTTNSFTAGDINENFDNELQLVLVALGLLIIAFTKEKIEDEQIAQLRLDCLQWAVYINYAVFFVIILTCYGLGFFAYTLYNVLTLLVFFIARFRWMIYQLNVVAGKEAELA